jgi:cytochrome c biogenesis protein CcmG/thiol:disulfide interchange protein DsbE
MRIPTPVAAALAVLVLASCSKVAANPTAGVVRTMDQPLGTLSGDAVAGGQASSGDAAGKVLVVNVWASWCAPCQQEQPALVQVAHRYTGRVAFLGVNYEDQTAAASAWVKRFKVPYPSVFDPSGKTAATLGYVGLPDTYLVDPGGTIRFAISGATTAEQLSGLLDQMLASPAPSAAASASAG